MTSQPDDHDQAPSTAALAVQVHGLRYDVEALTRKTDGLASTQRQHTILLDGLAELRNQIDHILELVTGQEDATPATWFRLTMPGHERDEKLAELTDWVNTVLPRPLPRLHRRAPGVDSVCLSWATPRSRQPKRQRQPGQKPPAETLHPTAP